ncbi:tail protein [Pseudomonas laurentiana]|uniref:Prothage tail length tape measure n=1 Tax=Pseudomonas laurentiana TaxID=2364649 RepID=A0A6I5RNY3_9PSED|nr:phage tail length tape measure family protein [Pseudomonas laurentiana]NES09296.1 prothage tail length tape measure [Pseudomonas laurentiana]GGU78974.1 tail protein [Pseudomonas laurentiana]
MNQTSRLSIEIDSRNAEQKAVDVQKALEGMESAGLRIKPAMDKAGAGLEGLSKSTEKSKDSVEGQREELERLLGSIDPVTRKLGELDKQEQALNKHRKAAGTTLDKSTYDEYLAKINATRESLTGFSGDLNKTGMSAKQTAAALRGVPAQFTDIATSLQGGQAPLTVFLQQGGQLKDMFGGVGPAAKALGGYVAGLINPFTLAGAAIAGFTLAAYKGYEQSEQYRKALTLTGDAAGKTADDLIAMSNAIAGGRNFDQASQAVLALASNGRLTGEVFTQVARAATEMSVATGKSSAEIADQLSSTKGSVTDLAAEYSDKYGVITQAVFDQIRSLEQQGDRMEAIKVLSGAVADEMGARNKEMVESTRGLAKAWDDVKISVAGVWSELKDRLAASPELFKLQHLQGQLQDAQQIGDKALIAGLEQQVALAQAAVDAQRQKSEAASAEQQARKAAIAADKQWNEDGLKYRSNQQKMEDEITKARTKGLEAKVSEAEIERRIADIRKEYADKEKKPAAPKAYTEDAGIRMLDSARQTNAVLTQQLASINGQGIAVEKIGTQAQALVKWEQQLADIKAKQTLTADQKSLLANQDLITAQLKRNAALEREAEIQKGIKQANDDQVKLLTLTGQLREANNLKSSLDDAAQMAEYERQGNTEAAKRLETLIKIRDINLNAAQKPGTVEGVSKAPTTTGLDPSIGGANSEITRLNDESARLDQWRAIELEKQKAYLDLKAINEEIYAERVANINNQAAENRAKIEQAKNSAILSSSADFFGNLSALSQSENSKLMAIGKAAAIAQATIQGYVAVQNALAVQPYPLGVALAISAGVAAAANVAAIAGIGFSSGGYTGPGGVNDPAGIVHKGEVVWSQADIRRFGGVAAVESLRTGNVTPISSARSASPASSGGTNSRLTSGGHVSIPIAVNIQAQPGMSDTEARRQGQQAGEGVRDIVRQVIQDEQRPGGMLA